MSNIFIDQYVSDDERRAKLYTGSIFVYSPSPSLKALVDFARELIEQAFRPHDPKKAQFDYPVEEYAAVLAKLKPLFIHHPRSKELIQSALVELGCDPHKTYFDVPRLRTATSDNYLTTGIAYAFHPHRDTWYSAPPSQLNWWLSVYDITEDNGLAFHTRYFNEPVKNSSRTYDYYQWNKNSRGSAAQHIKSDTRVQPKPEEEITLDPQVRIVTPSGGVSIFSGSHLHSTVPNTSGVTRFSIDFRTVHIDDVNAKMGARNIDSECTGTSLRDFLRVSDLERIPEASAGLYDRGPISDGLLIFKPLEKTS
jgi:Phytanoyl-CoA dioxygenase (PhyH)